MPRAARRPPPKARNIELMKIHQAASAMNLIQPGDDSAYRDMLWAVARVRSAKELDGAGRERVLAHLASVGWVDPRPFVPHSRRTPRPMPQPALIRHLWDSLGRAGQLKEPSDAALRAFVRRQSAAYHPDRVGYDAPELLPELVAQRVIEHLKKWCARCKVAWR